MTTPTTPRAAAVTPALRMCDLLFSMFITQSLNAVAELGVPDLLKDGPKTHAELAQATGSDARALHRVLRMLVGLEVFAEDARGRIVSTPLSRTLETGAFGSMREMVMLWCSDENWSAVSHLPRAVKTGRSAFQERWGKDFYTHLAEHPEKARAFQRAMVGISEPIAAAVAATYDFSGVTRLVDVGGGTGTYLRHILAANPALRGTLFDLPRVIEEARRLFADDALRDRVDFVAGDFFESVPGRGDAYIIEHVLHNWPDEPSITILKNIRRVMELGAQLLVVEPVITHSSQTVRSEILDVVMCVSFGGRCGERTEAEHASILEAAGFRITRIQPTESMASIIEARAA